MPTTKITQTKRSVTPRDYVWRDAETLSPTERRLRSLVWSLSRRDGWTRCSARFLAETLACSPSWLYALLRRGVNQGWLERSKVALRPLTAGMPARVVWRWTAQPEKMKEARKDRARAKTKAKTNLIRKIVGKAISFSANAEREISFVVGSVKWDKAKATKANKISEEVNAYIHQIRVFIANKDLAKIEELKNKIKEKVKEAKNLTRLKSDEEKTEKSRYTLHSAPGKLENEFRLVKELYEKIKKLGIKSVDKKEVEETKREYELAVEKLKSAWKEQFKNEWAAFVVSSIDREVIYLDP